MFNAVADTFEWILRVNGMQKIDHYLDDFALIGSPESDECAKDLATLQSVAEAHGISLATDKTVGPATRIVFLGIEVNTCTEAATLQLPQEKLAKLGQLLQEWVGKKSARKRTFK